MIGCTGGRLARHGVPLSMCAVALLFGIAPATAPAQEDVDTETRAIRPATMSTARPKPTAVGTPKVRIASPRPLVLGIGSGYSALKLSGNDLDRVTVAVVVKPNGETVRGFDVRIGSRSRRHDRLSLSLIAGKPVAPGDYVLRLTYEPDDPRPVTSPRDRRKAVTRTVVVPGSTLTIRAREMSPAITAVTPDPLVLGREYAGIKAMIDDLPGKEVVSVTRFPNGPSDTSYCDFQGTHYLPDEGNTATWRGKHNLEITLSPGTLIPRASDKCRLRFSVITRNELEEEFYSVVDKWIDFAPPPPDTRRGYPVADTGELKKYVGFRLESYAVGICDGTSVGTSGVIPVGLVSVGDDIALQIRSGPIGTKCNWIVYAKGLREGWELRMNFETNEVGGKCANGIETSAGGAYQFSREAPLYFRGGTLTLSVDNPTGEIPRVDVQSATKYIRYVNLSCPPTVTNDHGITLRMVSAELYGQGAPNCTWKCGVRER